MAQHAQTMTRIAQTTKMKYVDIYDLSVSFIIRTNDAGSIVLDRDFV